MGARSFHDFVRELLVDMGPVQIKRMFGGAGVYADGVMFGLIAEDTLYLKADQALKAKLGEAGGGPFIWTPASGPRAGERVEMGYWRLPDAALDDPAEAAAWGRMALAVARDAARAKRKAKSKRKS